MDNETEESVVELDGAAPGTEGDEEPKGLILLSDALPTELPLVPLRPRPAFPGLFAPMGLPEKEQVVAVRQGMEAPHHSVGLVLLRDPEGKAVPDNLHRVGVAAKIVKVLQVDDDEAHVVVNCLERFTLQEARRADGGLHGRVVYHHAPELSVNSELKAHSLAIIAALKELVQISPLYGEEIKLFLTHSSMSDPGRLADFAANLTTGDGQELQEILETFDVFPRINRVLVLLKKELEVSRLQTKIAKQIEEKVSAKQREFFLKEQFKALKKELGLEKEGKTTEIEQFRKRLAELTLPEDAHKVVEEELQKFQLLEPASPEYNVTRTYLDWLTVLPWGRCSKDSYDLKRARRVLDRDHYGLDDVKERIVEFIAVGKMKGDISGSILCLVGPPGTGKTSVGRSIADALGRTFYRFSLGGMRDEAEIKGHRRTYIGAMPGKFLQAMKTAGAANPVLMLDEIDKIGASFQGDPASALLEVLDPEQNATFRDHYLDVPFDLSNVLFVATANQLDTIPAPLLDRMEVIRLSGYIREEKVEIARRYLVPKALKSHGLTRGRVSIRKPALVEMAEHYAREAGVRQMEKLIKKIMRKASLAFAEGRAEKITIGKRGVEAYLGKPRFSPDGVVDGVPGVVTGLAWTSLGGVTLQVEAAGVRTKSKGFKQTGQLGDVMVESAEIAYSYLRARTGSFGIDGSYFDDHFVHLHVPAGATPKDGPSAGITMATALLSLATGTPVWKKRLGMTGELTLTGRILPIGGLKEKTVAARRAGLRALIFPEGNRRDFEELPDHLKEGLEVHFVEDYPEVHRIAFGDDST